MSTPSSFGDVLSADFAPADIWASVSGSFGPMALLALAFTIGPIIAIKMLGYAKRVTK